MAYHLISQKKVTTSDLEALRQMPEFRKATDSMMMSAFAAQEVLKGLDSIKKSEVAVVLGSNLGELETTIGFLETFYSTGMARPLLFQNSLHNAILGFLTIHLGLTGPSTTVSLEEETFLASLHAAETFLDIVPAALVVSSDFGHPLLNSKLSESSMKSWKNIEHADAFLFVNDSLVQDRKLKSLRSFEKLSEAKVLADWMK